jgi:hypothetical protein
MEPERMNNRHNLIAYLSTINAIMVLALAAAAVCLWSKIDSEVNLARIIGGLAFISSAIAGLTGIAGTFKATNQPSATTQTGDVNTTVTTPDNVAGETK